LTSANVTSKISKCMKYVITSKTSHKNVLLDDEADDFQKELLQVIASSEKGRFSVRPFSRDNAQEEIWEIYLTKITT